MTTLLFINAFMLTLWFFVSFSFCWDDPFTLLVSFLWNSLKAGLAVANWVAWLYALGWRLEIPL